MEGEHRHCRSRETERERGERGEGAIKAKGRDCYVFRGSATMTAGRGRAGASFVRKLARTKIAFRLATGDIHQNCYDQ